MELGTGRLDQPRRDPTLSVVVTSYNYGHFIEACLQSLYDQSRAPDQIVVIDDGSTDATAEILRSHAGRAEIIRTANGGQAAAFNAGFAASTGDIVIFLDADDLLHPEAVETVIHHWRDDVAAMTFGLETIDADGRSTGVYQSSIRPDRGDIRPRLLASGDFLFPPTSGNAFARPALARIMPMPTQHWRISADCYLIRAAAMVGRFEPIPHVLGSYRLHGSNNYALAHDEADMPARRAANVRDIAQALADLADNAAALAGEGEDAELLANLLRARSEARAAEGEALGTLGRQAPRFERSVSRLASNEGARALLEPRWPPHIPFGRWIELAEATTPSLDRSGVVRAVISVDPTPRLVTVEVSFADAFDDELTLSVSGEFVWRGRPGQEGTARFSLPARPWERSRTLQIELASVRRQARLHAILIAERVDSAVAYLEGDRPRPAWDALESGLPRDQWRAGDDGAAVLRGRYGRLHFFRPEGGDARLTLRFAGQPPAGWLSIRRHGDALFSGRTGPAGAIAVTLPGTRAAGNYVALDLDFEPDVAAGSLAFAAVALSIEAEGLPARNLVMLNAGEQVAFGAGGRGALLLDGGFAQNADGETQTIATEARLHFMLPAGARDMSVVLDIEPMLEPVDGFMRALAVSLDGETLVSAAVEGAGLLRVALPPQAAGREVLLVLHSVLVPTEPGAGLAAAHAPLLLSSLAFDARLAPQRGPVALAPAAPKPAGRHLIDSAAALLARDGRAPQGRLAELRRALVAWLAGCDGRALLLVAGSGEDLATLAELGDAIRHLPHSTDEAAARGAVSPTGSEAERLRHLLVAMLLALPQDVPEAAALSELPAPLLWQPRSLARWLTTAPEIDSPATQQAYVDYLIRLLAAIDTLLSREPSGSAGFNLAAATLDALRSTRAMFGDGVMRDLARARASAIERLLTRSGARLAMQRHPSSSRERLRVAVLVRDVMPNPEGFALRGMYRQIDRARFEPVLVRMDRDANALPVDDIFAEELCLSGLSIAGSVSAIRALDADILVTGCYVTDYEKTSAVLAHRLAPLQLWHAAVCPTTGGFSSFDHAISCMASEPADPQRHYTELLAFIDGPLQCAYAFPPLPAFDRETVRGELGVPDGALMLASGAMAHKIPDALLNAWAAILAGAPQAVLVLYPFARNWSMAFAQTRFRRRVDRALDAAGVALDRVILLDTQAPERARIVAAAADLYLDSFPYTGATTVCEALSAGTPVVTRTGDGLRLLTGASWLRAYGLEALCAPTADAYVATAIGLAKGRKRLATLRREIAARQKPGPAPHDDQVAFGAAWSATLARVAEESGLFPRFGARPRKAARNRGPAEAAQLAPAAPPVARSGSAPVRVAILASPRTGSTLLCDLVNASPGAICHYEIFHADMIQLRDSTLRDPVAIAARDADPVGFLDRISAEAARQGYGLVGFKHFAHLDARVTKAVIDDRATRIVQIGRANLLAQYSSERIAREAGSWFRARGEAWSAPKIRFHATVFERWMHYQRRIEGERMDQLAIAKREALFIDYTGLLDADLPGRLSAFLGFPIESGHHPNFERHNDDDILGRFDNPDEVAAFLSRRGLASWARGG